MKSLQQLQKSKISPKIITHSLETNAHVNLTRPTAARRRQDPAAVEGKKLLFSRNPI